MGIEPTSEAWEACCKHSKTHKLAAFVVFQSSQMDSNWSSERKQRQELSEARRSRNQTLDSKGCISTVSQPQAQGFSANVVSVGSVTDVFKDDRQRSRSHVGTRPVYLR